MSEASQTVTITHHPGASSGEYHAHVPGSDTIGRLTYQRRGNTLTADHTLVPPAIGGRGVAGKLVDALIADARAEGWKIVPQCSYVAAAFRRHTEWGDLLG